MTAAGAPCFHCGEPIPRGLVVHARIAGRDEQDVLAITQLIERDWRMSRDNRTPMRQRRVKRGASGRVRAMVFHTY